MTHERPGDELLSHRDRKKLQTKRRIHATALDLAASEPYQRISVESIAEQSGVSPSTVYRYFSTKVGIFLWDEYDDAVMVQFRSLLRDHHPIAAMSKAVHLALAGRFHLDEDRALTQLVLIQELEPLKQAMATRMDELRVSLAAEVSEYGWPPLEANVFAGAMISAFSSAFETWAASGGEESLLRLFDRAIRLLGTGLDSVT